MSLAAGFRLGPYEVVDLIGAGGMGEVYTARIVGDVRDEGLDRPPDPEAFIPYAQTGFYALTFVVRGQPGTPVDLSMLKEQIWAVDPAQSIYRADRLEPSSRSLSRRQAFTAS